MDYRIEQATPAEFLAVAALDRIAWPLTPDTFIPDGEHVWRVWCEHATVLVAKSKDAGPDGGIVGALLMFPTTGGETFLHKIMVHPDHRGRGVGTGLMEAALKLATTPVLLTVDPNNAAAVRLYRHFGFNVRERIDGYYRPHEDRFVMVHSGGV